MITRKGKTMEDKTYIMIFEDGSVKKTAVITDDDLASCDDGILTVVDITDPMFAKVYFAGDWEDVETV